MSLSHQVLCKNYNKTELDLFCSKYILGKNLVVGAINAVATGYKKPYMTRVAVKSIYRPRCQKLKEVYFLKKLKSVGGVINYLDHYYVKNTVSLLVMEYFGHMNLKLFLKTNGPVSESVAHTIFTQLVSTVKQCYHLNILHRKLKPSNILINVRTLQVKIINLNSASLIGEPSVFTTQLSSKNAPPEYFQFRQYTAEGLYVWSLGLILYELLFGRVPFQNPCEVVNASLSAPPTDNRVSLDVKLFLKWILTKLESDRITLNEMFHHPWITKKWC
jgi:serine/threonine protein kinase